MDRMSPSAPDVDRQTLERVELALPEWAGGFEVLERNLRFDGTQLAHWLAYSHGRVLLVSVVNGHSDNAVLRAMDGLSFAQNQPEILNASLESVDDPNPIVQVVLVALEGYSKLQLERLGTLPADRIELLRRRELSTSRGTHTRMESVECTEGGRSGPPVTLPDWSLEPEFRTFLARIAPDRLQLALTVIERMRRMDPQFGWQPEGTGLACLLDGKRLARLNWEAGHMQLFFNEDQPVLPIRDNAALEMALEVVLDHYLDLLSGGRSKRRHLDLAERADGDDPRLDSDRGSSLDSTPWVASPYREPTSELGDPSAEGREPDSEPEGIYGARPATEPQEFREPTSPPEPRPIGSVPPVVAENRPSSESRAAEGEAAEPDVEATGTQTERAESELSAKGEAALEELPELDDLEIQPLPPGPLLTAEEIEAFLE